MFIAPYKPIKIPERIIMPKDKNGCYKMYSLVSSDVYGIGDCLGKIKLTPTFIRDNSYNPNKSNYWSLYINNLKAKFKKCGIGTDLINFAKNLSKKSRCNGNLHVCAYNYENPGRTPHQFYRKKGFKAHTEHETKLIDRAIKRNEQIPAAMTQGTAMYFEPS